MKNLFVTAIFSSFLLFGCVAKTSKEIANQLQIQVKVKQNLNVDPNEGKSVGADGGFATRAELKIKNNGKAITGKDWAIYFSSIRRVLKLDNPSFKLTHITGDLTKIEPNDNFKGFAKNEEVTIPIVFEYWICNITDFMPNWFVTVADKDPVIIENTKGNSVDSIYNFATVGSAKRYDGDNNTEMNFETRYDKFQDTKLLDYSNISDRIIPKPLKVSKGDGVISLQDGINIEASGLSEGNLTALFNRASVLKINTNGSYTIEVEVSPESFKGDMARSEAYTLSVKKEGAKVIGFDDKGAFYGVQSIFSALNAKDKTLDEIYVEDAPRYEFRGMQVDVARHFKQKKTILNLLDQMAAYKLNKFHIALANDEGWRLEIKPITDLTEVGGHRAFDLSEKSALLPQLGSGPFDDNSGSGFYSEEDFVEILKYAKDRFIEVIPEINMPGHARAAVVSMESRYKRLISEGKSEEEASMYRLYDPNDKTELSTVQYYDRLSFINPALDSSKKFVNTVISEVKKMYADADLELNDWHFGGDEAKNLFMSPSFDGTSVTAEQRQLPYSNSPLAQKFVAEQNITIDNLIHGYWTKAVSKILSEQGIPVMSTWQDGLKGVGIADLFNKKNLVNIWDTLYWGGSDSTQEFANMGYGVILSNPDYLYFDFPQELNTNESGYYWGSRFIDSRKVFSFSPDNLPQNAELYEDRDGNPFDGKSNVVRKNTFYGMQGQAWGEAMLSDEQFEYMVYPRILALAERAWHKDSFESDYVPGKSFKKNETHNVDIDAFEKSWNEFANDVGQKELYKLDLANLNYRIPLPGAKIIDGKLNANIEFPGLLIQFNNAGVWTDYKETVDLGSVPELRAVNSLSRYSRNYN